MNKNIKGILTNSITLTGVAIGIFATVSTAPISLPLIAGTYFAVGFCKSLYKSFELAYEIYNEKNKDAKKVQKNGLFKSILALFSQALAGAIVFNFFDSLAFSLGIPGAIIAGFALTSLAGSIPFIRNHIAPYSSSKSNHALINTLCKDLDGIFFRDLLKNAYNLFAGTVNLVVKGFKSLASYFFPDNGASGSAPQGLSESQQRSQWDFKGFTGIDGTYYPRRTGSDDRSRTGYY